MKRTFIFVFLLALMTNLSNYEIYSQQKSKLEKLWVFNKKEGGFASLSSVDNTLLINYNYDYPYDQKQGGIFWLRNGKKIKSLRNVERAKISPDGKYYIYVKDKMICINNKKDAVIKKIPTTFALRPGEWAYDSKSFYFRDKNTIYNYNISTGLKKEILQSPAFFNPIPVKNENIIYLLKNINEDLSDPFILCEIYRYDLTNKTFSKISLPNIKNIVFLLT